MSLIAAHELGHNFGAVHDGEGACASTPNGSHLCESAPMIVNPGSDRAQGPWDPDAKKKWIDTRYFWVLMPFLLLMVGIMVLSALL